LPPAKAGGNSYFLTKTEKSIAFHPKAGADDSFAHAFQAETTARLSKLFTFPKPFDKMSGSSSFTNILAIQFRKFLLLPFFIISSCNVSRN
jgi:hypothetical protein